MREFGGGVFEFGGEAFFFVGTVFGQIDFTKGSGAELFDKFEILAYDEVWVRRGVP